MKYNKISSTSLSLLTSASQKNYIKLINNLIAYTVYNKIIIINYNNIIKFLIFSFFLSFSLIKKI